METGDRLTWMQRRELERELWLDAHLSALAEIRPEDLDDPEGLRAIQARATALAEVVGALRRMRGDDGALERDVATFRDELDAL